MVEHASESWVPGMQPRCQVCGTNFKYKHSNNLLWQKELPVIASRLDHGAEVVREENARKTKSAYRKGETEDDLRRRASADADAAAKQQQEQQQRQRQEEEEEEKSIAELKERAEARRLRRELLERRAQQQHLAEEAEAAYKLTAQFAQEVEKEREMRYAFALQSSMSPAQKAMKVIQSSGLIYLSSF
jgi:DNA repair exonuclease SbcCD ATPase subunit